MRYLSAVAALLLSSAFLSAQNPVQPDPAQRTWHAAWVTHPTAPLREPLVLHFRRTVDLAAVPASYLVRVSADNRFILYVNGQRVGDGPARGDLTHWRYERFDLAPYLKSGQNLITATVWNFGVYAPIAQMSDRTAFLLESDATGEASISTPKGWLVEEESGQTPLDRSPGSICSPTLPPAPARRSTPPATTGTGTPRPPRRQLGFRLARPCATASSPAQRRPLGRHHRRQPLGPDPGRAAAHGVLAHLRGECPSAPISPA